MTRKGRFRIRRTERFRQIATALSSLSTCSSDAHAILYMENGDIKEVGNHETLMELNGKYAALYNSQFA